MLVPPLEAMLSSVSMSALPQHPFRWNNVEGVAARIVECAPWGLLVYAYEPPDTLRLADANPAAERITRLDFSALVGKTIEEIWPTAIQSGVKARFLQVLRTAQPLEQERAFAEDGLTGIYKTCAYCIGEGYLAFTFEDVTALRDSEERFRMLAEATSEGIAILDGLRVIELNRAASKIFGYSRDEAIGVSSLEFIAPESRPLVKHHVQTQYAHAYQAWGQRKSGEKFPMRISGRPFRHNGRDFRVTTIRDLSNEQMIASLRRLATTDELTGLRNHRVFQEALRKEVERCKRSGSPLSLLVVDVDLFKNINDNFGHLVGDQVLRHLAHRLLIDRRVNDIVARYGGEEFAILLPDTAHEQAFEVAERIREDIEAHPLREAEHEVPATVSIGVASCPAHDDTPDGLFEAADSALYEAKHAGRNCTRVFDNLHSKRISLSSK